MDRALRGTPPPVLDPESSGVVAERELSTADEASMAEATRLDSPDKVRRFAAKLLMERAGVSEPVDPEVFSSDERFDEWVNEFNRTHAAGA